MRPYSVVDSAHHRIGRFDVCMDTLLIDGQRYPYSYAKTRNSVVVLPVLENARVGLIYQYRHAIDEWVYEAVAGGIEPGESPEQAAVRELCEEAGFLLDTADLLPLGAMYPVAGTSTEKMYLFAGHCAKQVAPQSEPTEFIRTVVMSFSELESRIADGSFSNMSGIALWYKYKLYQAQQIQHEDVRGASERSNI